MSAPATDTYALLAALAREAERAPVGTRTLVVAPTRGEGRVILWTRTGREEEVT